MTLCIDIMRTFSCIIRVFYSFVLLTVHLCAIVTRFNKCNLLLFNLFDYLLRDMCGPRSRESTMVLLGRAMVLFSYAHAVTNHRWLQFAMQVLTWG